MAAQRVSDGSVKVQGLVELRRSLRALGDKELAKELSRANKTLSQRVVTEARSRAESAGGVAKHTAGGIVAVGVQRGVFVGLDPKLAPGIFGAEFGGGKFGAGNPTPGGGYTTQFGPHRGRVGGALYGAVRAEAPKLVEEYGRIIDAIWEKTK